MRFFTLSKTHVAGRRILQDFPHIALGKSCKRGTSNYPDFPAIRAAKITNISKNADLPDTRIFPHGMDEGPDRSAPKGEYRITRILPRFFTSFGAQSLDTQGLARRPAPGDGGNRLPFSPPKWPSKKVESEWNCLMLYPCKGVKKRKKRALSGPFFWKSGWGREWHSRGQRFDPAYLHQEKRLETSVSSLFYAKFRTVFPCRTAFSANWAAPLNQLHYHRPQLRLDGRRTVPVAEKCTCPSHCLHTPIGYV